MQDAGIVIARLHGRVTQRFCRIRIQRRPLDAPDPADMLGTLTEDETLADVAKEVEAKTIQMVDEAS